MENVPPQSPKLCRRVFLLSRRRICGGWCIQLATLCILGLIPTRRSKYTSIWYTPTQKQSGKPGCFCLRRFEVIALTVCPLNGNCVYNHRINTGADCCGRSACAYPRLQKQQLAGAIAELLAVPLRTPAQEEKLERYRRYFRELNNSNERNER